MKFGVVTFPGSNCDYDAFTAVRDGIKQKVEFLWHQDLALANCDCVILPGGFSYGDYLRAGAIARFAPIMEKVNEFARRSGLVLGICNGFQMLTESGLLPGALLRNTTLRFVSKQVYLRVERNDTPFTAECGIGQVLKIPVAHGEGNYFASQEVVDKLEKDRRVVFRYCDREGRISPAANPNGSINNIAGIVNETDTVLGLMPHPERAVEPLLGSSDGSWVFLSLVKWFARKGAA